MNEELVQPFDHDSSFLKNNENELTKTGHIGKIKRVNAQSLR